MKCILIYTTLFLPSVFAIPVVPGVYETTSTQDIKFLQDYLEKFFPSFHKNDHSLEEQLKQMQEFFHLRVTGKMDKDTLNTMKQPRCGVPDVKEKYKAGQAVRWNKRALTYRINNYTPDMPRRKVDEAIAKAFQVWSDVTPLSFRKTAAPADIEIYFAYGVHSDNFPFDGRGNTLAHAFYPGSGLGGDAHFDEAEKWSEYNREVNLFLVAAHEFGHSLGLSHSNVLGSLMYPTYVYKSPNFFRLPDNDRQRIQRLYGKRSRNS